MTICCSPDLSEEVADPVGTARSGDRGRARGPLRSAFFALPVAEGPLPFCSADASLFALPEATLIAPARGRSRRSWLQALAWWPQGAEAIPLSGFYKHDMRRILSEDLWRR